MTVFVQLTVTHPGNAKKEEFWFNPSYIVWFGPSSEGGTIIETIPTESTGEDNLAFRVDQSPGEVAAAIEKACAK